MKVSALMQDCWRVPRGPRDHVVDVGVLGGVESMVGGTRLVPLLNFGEGSEDTEGLVM